MLKIKTLLLTLVFFTFLNFTLSAQTEDAALANNELVQDIPPLPIYDLIVFPNPSFGRLYLESESPIVTLEVYNASGLQIPFKLVSNRGQASLIIEIQDFTAGFYFIRTRNDAGETSTKKLVLINGNY